MYLAELSVTEKVAFLSLARHMVARDGKLQGAEQELLQALANEMSVPLDMDEDIAYLQAIQAMETRKARRITLLELIGLACSDGKYHSQEKQFVEDLAHSFDVSADQVANYESFIHRLGQFLHEGDRLIK